ncbi:MAG: ATP-binding domain-containing protein [Plectolyngbya sp. WJT66-NPBG17]|jgi:superfamily I DNA and RNA helicase|nr:ATP-binding domain-containing protein [Plectolyngbya sp. WJT66-NPBG17]
MPIQVQEPSARFVITEVLGKSGELGEQIVFKAVREAFGDRECLGFCPYPIFSKQLQMRWEPDILLADRELGLVVIEVKSIRIDQIVAVEGHQWQMERSFYAPSLHPYQQAENQLWALLGFCDKYPLLKRQVTGRAIIALPFITRQEWEQRGFDQLPCCPPIIFADQLKESELFRQVQQAATIVRRSEALTSEQWSLLLTVISGRPNLQSTPPQPPFNRAVVLDYLRQWTSQLDFQQAQIGWQIPPGPQRIRGIAGSGKTVLLCQKAAYMHWQHPDWDIALVFFTRSLYGQITDSINHWLRFFSQGELTYNPATSKLKVLHAWGEAQQPGLYSTIRNAHRLKVEIPEPINSSYSPPQKLAWNCKRLLEQNQGQLQPLFDALLIDEGQDLVVDGDEFLFEEKQPFYWMAYQALRPVDLEQPEQRRLIWAYDEAQSLDSLVIPQAKALFGEALTYLVRGYYPGGIKKSETMKRCYRTPAPILTAAHAIGMGLLRAEGMLSGLTRAEDWRAIGYEVSGSFISGQQVTLHRPSEFSPNPVPQLWLGDVLQFKIYADRDQELQALAQQIQHTMSQEKLQPSRQILVVVLGGESAIGLERQVAMHLRSQQIDYYIPSATKPNAAPEPGNPTPNQFWYDGAVTVSRIHRAKGNEADLVYVVGFDQVAQDESNITLRNQLFVALTRSRCWVCLSGVVGESPLYQEMEQVIESGDSFTFTFKRPPQRDVGGESEPLLRPVRRIAALASSGTD